MRRSPKSYSVSGSIACLLLTASALNAMPDTDCGSWAPREQEEKIRGIQCGFYATAFVLEYFDVDNDAERVSSELPVTQEGASLADIQQILAAFGLETLSRGEVDIRQIVRALDRDTVAIVPLAAWNGVNHYFVAALDNAGRAGTETGTGTFDAA